MSDCEKVLEKHVFLELVLGLFICSYFWKDPRSHWKNHTVLLGSHPVPGAKF